MLRFLKRGFKLLRFLPQHILMCKGTLLRNATVLENVPKRIKKQNGITLLGTTQVKVCLAILGLN
jgi:hypothetical protein